MSKLNEHSHTCPRCDARYEGIVHNCRTYRGRFIVRADWPPDQRLRFYTELRQLWEAALLQPGLKRAHKHITIALEVLSNTYSADDLGGEEVKP